MQFITDFAPRLAKISPHFTADARVVGGSLFRIHRDTRLAKDKTPYKENTGVQFRHEAAKDAHAPGYYLHIQPSGTFMGVGRGDLRPQSPTGSANTSPPSLPAGARQPTTRYSPGRSASKENRS